MSDIKSIGRQPNPAERGVMFVQERPEVLDHIARNFIAYMGDLLTSEVRREWDDMTEDERDEWRERALERLRADARDYVPPTDPDDPDPGSSRPTEDMLRVA